MHTRVGPFPNWICSRICLRTHGNGPKIFCMHTGSDSSGSKARACAQKHIFGAICLLRLIVVTQLKAMASQETETTGSKTKNFIETVGTKYEIIMKKFVLRSIQMKKIPKHFPRRPKTPIRAFINLKTIAHPLFIEIEPRFPSILVSIQVFTLEVSGLDPNKHALLSVPVWYAYHTQTRSDRSVLVCTGGLSVPVWERTQRDPLSCARVLGILIP